MLHYELLLQGQTVTGTVYANQLQKLAYAVRERRPRRASIHLLHDNARPHVAKETGRVGGAGLGHILKERDIYRLDGLLRSCAAIMSKKRVLLFSLKTHELKKCKKKQKCALAQIQGATIVLGQI
ncbi:hypothetical protein Y032_0020g233 [Ancylostoma ceylanicum]|uniref:Uncharacterized protein n=1 Tax=Ancylostoma ceylanicum TaxID=53326 RepID=A0A016V333_9BILA|nr:hypothetical protein Y032_0020g233 [Ancylostoma ceylanicum]